MLADKRHGHDGGAELVVVSPVPSAVTRGGEGGRGSASILKQWIKIMLECQYSCTSMLPIAIFISSTLHRYLNNAAYNYRI